MALRHLQGDTLTDFFRSGPAAAPTAYEAGGWIKFAYNALTNCGSKEKRGYGVNRNPLNLLGWGTGIRTPISGVRVRCLAVRPSPSKVRRK